MSSRLSAVQNPVESMVRAAAVWFGLVALPFATACRGSSPPESPALVDVTESVAADTASPIQPPTTPRPRPRHPPVRTATPAEPLVEHSGDLGGPISYIVAETPTVSPSSPLIVLLHGRGDQPERFVALAHRLAAQLQLPIRFIVARAPLPFGLGQGRQWFDGSEVSPEVSLSQRLDDIDGLFKRLSKTYPQAPLPALVGFSQGGMMALHIAYARPSAIAGAASLSGAFVTALGSEPASKTRPPVFVAAGDRDQVIPASRSQEAADFLESKGFSVKRVTFVGGHRIPDDVVVALGAWLGVVFPVAPATTP